MSKDTTIVLLTATVDPRNVAKVARRDPRQRLEDYKTALRACWLSEQRIANLIFCENSNHDLKDIHQLCYQQSGSGRRTELISFEGQQFPPYLGKGYGEIGIISYALRHSNILQDGNPLIIKATGRLMVANIGTLIKRTLENQDFDIACDFRGNLQWVDSRIFIARKHFLQNYLVPMQDLADESCGMTFEHILGRATHKAIGDGLRWLPMSCTPEIQGIAGTCGTPYPKSWAGWFARDMFRRVKNLAVAR
jgi:hypothetical protein